MKVKVEHCWSGGDRYSWRFTANGKDQTMMTSFGRGWDRQIATEALDFLERNWGIKRRNVRFV